MFDKEAMDAQANKIRKELREKGCDADNPSVYYDNEAGYICRCVVCARCGHHTGNSNQGHFWQGCRVLVNIKSMLPTPPKNFISATMADRFHFCCPGDCEIYNEDGTKKNAN